MEYNDDQRVEAAAKTPSPITSGVTPLSASPAAGAARNGDGESANNNPPVTSPPRLDTARVPKKHRRPSMAADLPSASQILAEHHYLVGDLTRQNARAMALLRSQDEKQAQLRQLRQLRGTATTTAAAAEARRLRKALGFAQSQLADAEQQERLVWARLGDLCAQMQSRRRLAQLESERLLQQQQQEQQQQQQQPLYTLPPLATGNVALRVTFAEPNPVVHGDDSDGARQAWADYIPLTPFATAFPTPFSSPAVPMPPSPMSPLAPVFQPQSSGFFADADHTNPAPNTATDQQPGPDSLDSVLAAVAKATQATLEPGTSTDVYADNVHDADDNGAGDYVVIAGVDDSSPSPPKSSLVRRGSHSAVQHTQDKHKRMSLPVRLSWDELQ